MKKNQWLVWVALGLAAWWIWKQSKNKGGATSVQKLTDTVADLMTPGGSAARESAQEAKTIVADAVDKTTFLPDLSTDRDKYMEDQTTCNL